VYVQLAVAVPSGIEVHPDLALRAIGQDDPGALLGDAGRGRAPVPGQSPQP
jgi:hypothetical protein